MSTVYKCTEQFMHAFTACKRLRVIEKYVFTVYAGIHERLDIIICGRRSSHICCTDRVYNLASRSAEKFQRVARHAGHLLRCTCVCWSGGISKYIHSKVEVCSACRCTALSCMYASWELNVKTKPSDENCFANR